MKLVIEIDEETYKYWKKHKCEMVIKAMSPYINISKAIANGTPLPKGHGRLIDADKLKVGEVYDDEGHLVGYNYLTKYEVDNAPTIIDADKESD